MSEPKAEKLFLERTAAKLERLKIDAEKLSQSGNVDLSWLPPLLIVVLIQVQQRLADHFPPGLS